MDPFSIFVSAGSLLDMAVRASGALILLYREMKNAPDLILALSNEIADITLVLDRVYDARLTLVTRRRHDSNSSSKYLTILDSHLATARIILGKLEQLSTGLHERKRLGKSIRWCLIKPQAEELKHELKNIRARIREVLIAYNSSTTALMNDDIHDIRKNLQHAYDKTLVLTSISTSVEQYLQQMSSKIQDIHDATSAKIPMNKRNADLTHAQNSIPMNNLSHFEGIDTALTAIRTELRTRHEYEQESLGRNQTQEGIERGT
ncbi:hypothetical protein V8E51_005294 [Hyaloscypha variabilis]